MTSPVWTKSSSKFAINLKLSELIDKAHGGAGLQHVTKGRVEETVIDVAPLREQRRIVSKIEELFSELDASGENLGRARAQLKNYRQVLLKAAFEGKLTADWRAANADKLNSPEALIEQVQAARRSYHETQLRDWAKATKSSQIREGLERYPNGLNRLGDSRIS